ncbi:glycosyltransferase family 4 protein [Mesorhizobium sp. CAU 1741]|uniref:glycosyltransferase family 4 protein n=1 Tax=Mesorhizobium sp. CAU 1741 TaxID=3140366 RepID=UPI00325B6505
MKNAAFAIPGDIDQRTGGYIYERSLLHALRDDGRTVRHVELPGTFPSPSPAEMAQSVELLAGLPAEEPLILDGLVYGSIDTQGLARVRSPLVAMIHHPLGLETGLPADRARQLIETETANLALADHVLVPSPHTARVLVADFAVAEDRITIAPPGFSKPSNTAVTKASPPLILSVGLLAARKGHDVLLRALARVTDLEWRADIVGKTHDPAVHAELAALIDANDLGDRVRLCGELDTPALDSLFRQASLFALATRYEGYGMVFSEALAYGLPIVTCRAGAVPETVPDGTGILVEVDDDEAFAHALRRMLADEALRDAMASHASVAGGALRSWADTARSVGVVLDRLAAARGR